jgi:hypothetical protein
MSKSLILFWLRNCLLALVLGGGAMSTMGCGMLGALSNPKVAAAMSEDASMYVVLRRSKTAEKIADSVDMAMGKAPGEGDDGWMKTISDPTDALKAEMDAASKRHHYAHAHAPIRVLPSEGWAKVLPDAIQKGSGKTFFALISSSLVDQYAAVADLKKQIGDLKGQIDENKEAMDKDGADKDGLSKKNDDAKAQIGKLEDQVDPLLDKLIAGAKDASSGLKDADAAKTVATVVVRLRQAVDDAKVSNGSALVGYPKAIPGMKDLDRLKTVIVSFIVEYVEEKTGKVVDTSKLSPDVTLDGLTPKITINGLSPDDLGKLSIGDLTSAMVDKTKKFLGEAVSLPVRVNRVQEMLNLESKILGAVVDGLKAQGVTVADVKDIDPVSVTPKK